VLGLKVLVIFGLSLCVFYFLVFGFLTFLYGLFCIDQHIAILYIWYEIAAENFVGMYIKFSS